MLESLLPDLVSDEETLVRFLTQSNHYSSGRVKPTAFIPNPRSQNTSVFRVEAEPAIICTTWDSLPATKRQLKASAVVLSVDVRKALLDVFSYEPPPRHANIENWYWDSNDSAEQRARQLKCASLVASKARLIENL